MAARRLAASVTTYETVPVVVSKNDWMEIRLMIGSLQYVDFDYIF
jgi:hypothetical protein